MVKKLGDVDKVLSRKTRTDKGKKRKLFMGKKPKGKRQIKFERKTGSKTHLKLWIWQYVQMSKEGRKRWNKYTRAYACPFVCPSDRRLRIDAPITFIDTKAKMEQFVAENMWEGTFYVMGFSNSRNRYRCKPVKICKVVVKSTERGNIGMMINNYRLHRYSWFYKG